VREDAPISVKGWNPENYSREYFGPVTLTRALSLSLNTVAVRLGLEVGPRTVVDVAHRLGIASELEPNASIALGTSEVTPLEMATAYAAFANGGVGVQPHVIMRVKTVTGKQLYQRRNASFGRVIDPQYVALMNAMMQETLLTGTARKAELPGWQAAGKTGTSQDWRDAWFVGYTSYLVTAVWLGNDDNSPTKKVSGGNLPVEIWSRFMKAAHQGVPPAPLPLGTWRNPESPNPNAPLEPLDLTRAQAPTGGRGGRQPQAAAPPQGFAPAAPIPGRGGGGPAADAAPIPPAPIPGAAGRDRGFLNKLFGTL
jgi:penicillin-binding protein 1A